MKGCPVAPFRNARLYIGNAVALGPFPATRLKTGSTNSVAFAADDQPKAASAVVMHAAHGAASLLRMNSPHARATGPRRRRGLPRILVGPPRDGAKALLKFRNLP